MSDDTPVMMRKIVSQLRFDVRRNGGVLRHSPVPRHEMVSQDTGPVPRHEAGGLRHHLYYIVLYYDIEVGKDPTARVAVSPHSAVEYLHTSADHKAYACTYITRPTHDSGYVYRSVDSVKVSKRQCVKIPKQQSIKESKRQSVKVSKRQSFNASERQSVKASKRQSVKTSKRQSVKASKRQRVKARQSVKATKSQSLTVDLPQKQRERIELQTLNHTVTRAVLLLM